MGSESRSKGIGKGDRVKVRSGHDHGEGTAGKSGLVVEESTTALGILFDDMPEIHRWYVESELERIGMENERKGFESTREAIKRLIESLVRTPERHDRDTIEAILNESEVRFLSFSHDTFHEKFLENSDGAKRLLEASRVPGFSLTVQRLYQQDRLYLLVKETSGATIGVQFLKSRLKLLW